MIWNPLHLLNDDKIKNTAKRLFKRFYPEFEFLEIRWLPSVTAYQRFTDPEQGTEVPFFAATPFPNTGGLRVVHPLDFDQSPGTSVGRDPSLVFFNDNVAPRPIIEFVLTRNAGLGVPTRIEVDFTFDGTAQTTVTFSTSGHSAGDTYLLAGQAASAVTSTRAYSWSATIRTDYSGQTDTDTPSGT